MPRISVSIIVHVVPRSVSADHRRGDVSQDGLHQEFCQSHEDEEDLCHQFK